MAVQITNMYSRVFICNYCTGRGTCQVCVDVVFCSTRELSVLCDCRYTYQVPIARDMVLLSVAGERKYLSQPTVKSY